MHWAACFGERRMDSCDADNRKWHLQPQSVQHIYMNLRYVRPESTLSMSYNSASKLLPHTLLPLPLDSIDQHTCSGKTNTCSGKHVLSHHNRPAFHYEFLVSGRWSTNFSVSCITLHYYHYFYRDHCHSALQLCCDCFRSKASWESEAAWKDG